MKKEVRFKLAEAIKRCQVILSDPKRACNFGREIFRKHEVFPLSEDTAIVIWTKHTGSLALQFWYYEANRHGWVEFFPTYNHAIGMKQVQERLQEIEKKNHELFEEQKFDEGW